MARVRIRLARDLRHQPISPKCLARRKPERKKKLQTFASEKAPPKKRTGSVRDTAGMASSVWHITTRIVARNEKVAIALLVFAGMSIMRTLRDR